LTFLVSNQVLLEFTI